MPGIPGVSDNIRVISIIDKFLEHARISYFQNDDDPQVFLSSADWMPRNFRRRVEIFFPVEEPRLKARIVDNVLGVALTDNVKARELGPDGTYHRVPPAAPAPRSPRVNEHIKGKIVEAARRYQGEPADPRWENAVAETLAAVLDESYLLR